jgi:two-component system phosphate regulon sensor histidine kinase PhoR
MANVQHEAALDAVFAATGHGMIICNRQGTIIRMNDAAMRMLEYTPADMNVPSSAQARLFRILSPDGHPLPPNKAPLLRALRGETVTGVVTVLERRDGGRAWLLLNASPIQAADGTVSGTVVSLANITAQQRLSEEKEDLLRAVSHDLRNPLAAIRVHTHVLLDELKRTEQTKDMQEHAAAILSSSSSIEAMIQGLVDAARLEGGQLRPQPELVELRAFISDLLARQATHLPVQRVRLDQGEDLLARADPHFVERILLNLLSNAFKYSSPETDIFVTFTQQQDTIVTSIRDQGPGISPADLLHLFERYYRAASVRGEEGLGLGLYIARMLVTAQGGQIWAQSREGKGSTFSFSLPAASKKEV